MNLSRTRLKLNCYLTDTGNKAFFKAALRSKPEYRQVFILLPDGIFFNALVDFHCVATEEIQHSLAHHFVVNNDVLVTLFSSKLKKVLLLGRFGIVVFEAHFKNSR